MSPYHSSNKVFLCMTFKTSESVEQILISDYTSECRDWRGVSLSSSFLKINGVDNKAGHLEIPVDIPKNQWMTVAVICQGCFQSDKISSYLLRCGNKEMSGDFNANKMSILMSNDLTLGDIDDFGMPKPFYRMYQQCRNISNRKPYSD